MATLDLNDLITPLKAAIDIPGEDSYDTVTPAGWTTYLANGFWQAYLDGFLEGYSEEDGEISQASGVEMPKDQQQLIVMYAAIAIIRLRMLNLQTVFRAKAGPGEYEVQQSASVNKALLDEFTARRLYLIQRLADSGIFRGTFYIDSFASKQRAINDGFTSWIM